jgi:aryl-alcohol dehydrogenase-like predicted oxidoreductase
VSRSRGCPFDTADVYSTGIAEQILGEVIKGKRNRLLISTKTTFLMGDGPNQYCSSRQHLIQAIEASLARLGVDHIDLLRLHGQDYNTPVEGTLSTLDQLILSGKRFATSNVNFSGWHLMKSLAELQPLGRDQGALSFGARWAGAN